MIPEPGGVPPEEDLAEATAADDSDDRKTSNAAARPNAGWRFGIPPSTSQARPRAYWCPAITPGLSQAQLRDSDV